MTEVEEAGLRGCVVPQLMPTWGRERGSLRHSEAVGSGQLAWCPSTTTGLRKGSGIQNVGLGKSPQPRHTCLRA